MRRLVFWGDSVISSASRLPEAPMVEDDAGFDTRLVETLHSTGHHGATIVSGIAAAQSTLQASRFDALVPGS